MLRCHVVDLGSLLLGALSFGGWSFSRQGSQSPALSTHDDANGQHYVVGYRLDDKCQFVTRVAQRCHDIVQHPDLSLALSVARRSGTESYLIDLNDGCLLQALVSQKDHHLYGHGMLHQNGEWPYTTESGTTDPGRGVLGVYRFDGERLRHGDEIPTHGLGPHRASWMPDDETLVAANGGTHTEAENRVEMNLSAMKPSLVLTRHDGNLLSKETLAQQMNSTRHLTIGRDGIIVAGQQFVGDAHEHTDLLATKRSGCLFEAFPMTEEQRLAIAQYTAGVAIHGDLCLMALTTPCDSRFFIWDLDSDVICLDVSLPDCVGVDAMKNGFIITSEQGCCRFYDCQGECTTA